MVQSIPLDDASFGDLEEDLGLLSTPVVSRGPFDQLPAGEVPSVIEPINGQQHEFAPPGTLLPEDESGLTPGVEPLPMPAPPRSSTRDGREFAKS